MKTANDLSEAIVAMLVRAGEPLSETQKIMLTGALAVWLNVEPYRLPPLCSCSWFRERDVVKTLKWTCAQHGEMTS